MQVEINGRSTGPGIQWPNGCRAAVMLTFDFEAETLRISNLARQGKEPDERDQGRYGGNEGIWRCLKMLDTYGVKGTFFTPSYVLEQYPEAARAIHAGGHEIAYHGIMHEPERDNSPEDEENKMAQAEAVIQKITGRRPVGHRAPHSTLHPAAYDLMRKRGYLYSSNLRDCDFAYLHQGGADVAPLVELPSDVVLDDYTYYYYSFAVEPSHRVTYTNQEYIQMLKEEFDGIAAEGDKIMVLKLHPAIIGRPGRIKRLGDFIGYMQQQKAWIATCEEVARYVLDYEKGGDSK